MSIEESIVTWILESKDNGYENGFSSKDIIVALNSNPTTTCRILLELIEDDILCRNRVNGKWFYRIKNDHETEDYINTMRARAKISKVASNYAGKAKALKRKIENLEKMGKVCDLFVSCECGRRIGLNINLKEINDSS